MKQTDQILQNVIEKFNKRSAQGIAKYGTTLADNNTDDFLTHLQEELMDAVCYIEKLKQPAIQYNSMPGLLFAFNFGNHIINYIICDVTNEVIKILPEQQGKVNTGGPANYILIDEFTNPELFDGEPIFTDKRFAKII